MRTAHGRDRAATRRLAVLLVLAALAICVHALPSSSAQQTRRWHLTVLGSLGGRFSEATAINDQGVVAGSSRISADSKQWHCFIWQDGHMSDIGALPGQPDCDAVAINNAGDVAGSSGERGFLWHNGHMTDLGTLGGSHTEVTAMNSHGWITGESETKELGTAHAFLWHDGTMIDLGAQVRGSSESDGVGIDERGEVAGNVFLDPRTPADLPPVIGVLWRNGKALRLPPLGDDKESWVYAMNARGEVVGTSSHGSADNDRGVIWRNGKAEAVAAPAAFRPRLIAPNGTVALQSSDRWFLYRNGRLRGVPQEGANVDALNNRIVVGARHRAFVIRLGIFRWLPGGVSSVYAVNERDEIVGETRVRGPSIGRAYPHHAALWRR